MNLLEFFSREAGQKRRRWLDETVGDAIEYFIPPNLRPAAEFIAEANPVQAMGNAMSAGGVVFDPEQTREARLRAAGDMGLEMAMSLAPAALVRMGYLAAPAGLLETFSTPSIDAAVDIGQGILSDATYAARSVAEGDPRGVLEAFQRGGEAQALSADAVGTNTLRVYHGGPQKLSASEVEMRPDPEGMPIGFSVTDNPDVAEYYRNMRGGGSISEFDIDLDKANIISESELYQFIDDLENRLDADASYEQIQQGLLDAGIDAIQYPDPEFGIRVVNPNILAANRSKLLGAGLLTTKEELDPQRLSKVKLPSYVADIDYIATPTGDLAAKNIVDIADLQGTTLIPAFGDRTYGGAKLEEISGVKLDQPVDMQGGHDFMRDLRTGLWASEENAMRPKAKFIDELIDAGEDPRMIYTAMGGQSADFSHHMADATMGLIEQSKISKKAAKEYDDIVREKLDPNWVGILSPKARDYLHKNMTGTLRRELWQEMDKGKWQKMGFPHLGVARASITDPELLTVEPFSSGLSIGKPSGGGLLNLQNKMPHKSYDAQIGGEYIGGLLDQVRGDMIFRDFFNARRAANIPTAGDQRSFMMSPYTKQVVDQQMVDEVSQYLESLRGRR